MLHRITCCRPSGRIIIFLCASPHPNPRPEGEGTAAAILGWLDEGGVGVGKNIVVISILILCSLAIVWYRNTFVIIDGNLNLSVLFVDKELRGLLTDEDLVVGSAKLNNESTSEVAEIEVIFKEPNVAKELASRIVGVSYDGEIFQSTVTTGENGRAVIAVKRISEQDLQKIIQTINR